MSYTAWSYECTATENFQYLSEHILRTLEAVRQLPPEAFS